MRRKVISASLLSLVLGTMLSLSAIYSGIGIAKADSVIATIPDGPVPWAISFALPQNKVFVSHQGANTVSVIDAKTNSVTDTIIVGSAPDGLAYDSANGNIYVANANSGTISVVDSKTNRAISTIQQNDIQKA